MKRRNFVKGLAALALTPLAAITNTRTPPPTDKPMSQLKHPDHCNISLSDNENINDFGRMNLQHVKINGGLSREEMFKVTEHRPYHRYVNFPIKITEEIKK